MFFETSAHVPNVFPCSHVECNVWFKPAKQAKATQTGSSLDLRFPKMAVPRADFAIVTGAGLQPQMRKENITLS